VFESWVASEILKARVHRGLPASLSFFRDRKGAEVDLLVELGRSYLAVETKSGQTVADDFFSGLQAFDAVASAARPRLRVSSFIVYGGESRQRRSGATVLPWSAIDGSPWWEADEL
jgi:hypothetical protein